MKYLALRVGDEVAVLPTAGFTAGVEYTRLKAGGVSTRKFEYAVRMLATEETDAANPAPLSMEVSVDEKIYKLTDDADSPMYYYDVYAGKADGIAQWLREKALAEAETEE